MEELLEKITRIPQVRACTVLDTVGSEGTLVTWLRAGGDPVPLELAAREVFEVMSDLLPENPDSPALAATFDANSRLLARRFGNYFAMVICDRDADLVNVRVALQGLALKISLHQRALSLSDPPRSARQPPPPSAKSPPAPSPRNSPMPARASDPAISTRSGTPDSTRPSTGSRASAAPQQRVNAIKMRDELVRVFSNQLGPLAALLVDEQVSAHGGLQDTAIAFSIGETLLAHVKGDDQRAKVRAEVDKLVRSSTVALHPSSPPDRNTPPYRTMPESIEERKVAALAQLFVEFVGPIGKLVFDEECGAARTGAILLRPQARTLLQSLAQHVPTAGRKSFLDRAERLLGGA